MGSSSTVDVPVILDLFAGSARAQSPTTTPTLSPIPVPPATSPHTRIPSTTPIAPTPMTTTATPSVTPISSPPAPIGPAPNSAPTPTNGTSPVSPPYNGDALNRLAFSGSAIIGLFAASVLLM